MVEKALQKKIFYKTAGITESVLDFLSAWQASVDTLHDLGSILPHSHFNIHTYNRSTLIPFSFHFAQTR